MGIVLLLYNLVWSTALYGYLHKKTRISIKFLYIDNIIVGGAAFIIIRLCLCAMLPAVIFSPLLVIGLAFGLTMIRFWRTPHRKVSASYSQIVSPADGNVIYVKRIEKNEIPISIKNREFSRLDELTKTDLLNTPCWLIGINMTLFDVHKNCSPIDGEIVLVRHFNGRFISLKDPAYLSENERNTFVIKNKSIQIGVVQIASKRVRRIDSYVKNGDEVTKGQWIGMIRFGSQVDVILPIDYKVCVEVGQQVYAVKSIIADKS